MSRSVRLRPWQKRALDQLAASAGPNFLAVATPGAGKTTFALTAARVELAHHQSRRLVVVVPTQHLKVQWADAATAFDLDLEPEWSPTRGLPADVHGVIVTYQQVAANPRAVAALSERAMVILDEIHHAGDDRAWGSGIQEAFELASRRLCLSGTPFRSDTTAIPFVRYRLDEAEADFEYGYTDALRDGGVVRPVYFPRLNGEMEWSAPDGSLHRATFDDPLERQLANQRLRTALSAEGEWLPAVLGQAHRELMQIRERHARAGGLVIAMDQEHARAVAALLLRRFGSRAVVATSDDAEASERISRFAASDAPWIVAVRMVSEGVDIPRLRVGVFATNTTTELFFRQAVGRLVRWTPGVPRQRSYLFIPDDLRLRTHAHQLADSRRHSLRRRQDDADAITAEPDPSALDVAGEPEQLSLFAALSATPLGAAELPAPADEDPLAVEPAAAGSAAWPQNDDLLVMLGPLPALPGRGVGPALDGRGMGPALPGRAADSEWAGGHRAVRQQLRQLNAAVAAELVARTGQTHAQVNGELNRLSGIRRVTEATNVQLRTRFEGGRRWLEDLRKR